MLSAASSYERTGLTLASILYRELFYKSSKSTFIFIFRPCNLVHILPTVVENVEVLSLNITICYYHHDDIALLHMQVVAYSDGQVKIFELLDPLNLKNWQLQVRYFVFYFTLLFMLIGQLNVLVQSGIQQ